MCVCVSMTITICAIKQLMLIGCSLFLFCSISTLIVLPISRLFNFFFFSSLAVKATVRLRRGSAGDKRVRDSGREKKTKSFQPSLRSSKHIWVACRLKWAGCVHIQMHHRQQQEQQKKPQQKQHMLHTRTEEQVLQSSYRYSYNSQLRPRPFVAYYIRS